jgi:hypothetical protein
MKPMKIIPVIVTIVALMLNIMSAGHAYACEQDGNYGKQIIKAADDVAKNKNSVEKSNCAQCSCHNHSNQSVVSKTSGSEFIVSSKEAYNWDNILSLSQLSFPPSKPPKA